MSSYTVFTLATLAAVAQAITITSPSTSTLWDNSVSNKITWTSVSTDPTTVDIYLSHQASQPTLNDLLFSNFDVSKGSVDVSGLQLPTGSAYQINFVKPNSPEQIYAQSSQFNVTGTATSASSTLPGYTGPTFTPSSTSTSISSTSASSSSSSATDSTLTTSLTSSSSATGSVTSATGTSASTLASGSSTATGTSPSTATGSSTGTSASTATSTRASASASPNAAAELAASAPLAALVFGAVAMFA